MHTPLYKAVCYCYWHSSIWTYEW